MAPNVRFLRRNTLMTLRALAVVTALAFASPALAAEPNWWSADAEQALDAGEGQPQGTGEGSGRRAEGPAQGDGVPRREHARRGPHVTQGRLPADQCEPRVQGPEGDAVGKGRARRDLPQRRSAVRQRRREARRVAQGVLRAVHAAREGLQDAGRGGADAEQGAVQEAEARLLHAAKGTQPEPEGVDRVRARRAAPASPSC